MNAADAQPVLYTALNFLPVLTLCAVVYAAGAYAQRAKDQAERIGKIEQDVDKLKARCRPTKEE